MLIQAIARKWIPDCDRISDRNVRERYGVLSGILGIICNGFLFTVKLVIGLLMNSVAIISDAINNLSDMGSSLVVLIGAKLSNRRPDKEHPFGHGRLEYISALIVSFLIMIVGFELLRTSIEKIVVPEPVSMNWGLLAILCVSMLVKVWMFLYNRYIGEKINSSVQKAAAYDSINDVIATGAVVLSAMAGHFLSGWPVDGVVGTGVSLLVMYTGFGIAKDTIGMLLGTPPAPELVQQLNDMIMEGEGIVGVHDLIIHDYGPGRVMASAHAEVPDDINIVRIHEIIDTVEQHIHEETGVTIVIHMDPISINDTRIASIKKQVIQVVEEVDPHLTIHDFRLTDGEERINLIFDLVVPFELSHEDGCVIVKEVERRLKRLDERYHMVITMERTFT